MKTIFPLAKQHWPTKKDDSATCVAAEKASTTRYEGPIRPVVASILGIIAWAVFILLYALFWSNGFNLFQNIIVTIVSLIITGLLIGLMWVIWGPKGAWRGA